MDNLIDVKTIAQFHKLVDVRPCKNPQYCPQPPGIWLRQTLRQVEFLELNSETWNMSPENIVLSDVAFVLTKSDTGLPSYAFSSKSALKARLVRKGLNYGIVQPYYFS